MKKLHVFIVLGVMLLLIPATTWASDRLVDSQDTPAILAAVDQTAVTQLDDSAIAEIRGESSYVMVKLFPLNFLDRFPEGVGETWNPLLWMYGNYGGLYNVGGTGILPVDGMDYLFQQHDGGGISDAQLFAALQTLPKKEPYPVWGSVYLPGPGGNDLEPPLGITYAYDGQSNYIIKVSRISLLSAGGTFRFFRFWESMPLTEYARRQAATAMGVLSLLP